MQTIYIIGSKALGKLKQKARRLKKDKGIAHNEALESVAKDAGFPGWRHVVEAAKAFAPTEAAYLSGTIVAYDVKDGLDFHDPENRFVEDGLAFALCLPDVHRAVVTADGEDMDAKSEEERKADLREWVSDSGIELTFFRLDDSERLDDVTHVIERTRRCCFWPPEYVWHNGVFSETPAGEVRDEQGEIVGVRFSL